MNITKTPKEQHIETITGIPIEAWEKNNEHLSKIMSERAIQLNSNQSNLIWAAKHWFEPKLNGPISDQQRHINWWKVIGAVYKRAYLYKPNVGGIHSFVQETWLSVCPKLPQFKWLFEELLTDSLPVNSYKFTGAPKTCRAIWDETATYNSKQAMMARVAAMMSQLSLLSKDEISLASRWTDLDVDSVDISDIFA